MKPFHDANADAVRDSDLDGIAQLAVETGVRLIRLLRRAVRRSPPATLSLSGLRALAFLVDNPGVCLSDVAEHLLVGVPTASKQVDHLVDRGLLTRAADASDRRRLALTVTPEGEQLVLTAARPAQAEVALLLARLGKADRARVREGLSLLRSLLDPVERDVPDA